MPAWERLGWHRIDMMIIDITKEELKILMDCVNITDESIKNLTRTN